MKIIIGLGNPEEKYFKTRHNIGFLFLDYLCQKMEMPFFEVNKGFNSMLSEFGKGEDRIFLLKPLTYMNRSGEAVSKIRNYYKVDDEDILIVYDDLDLPFEKIRFRKNGSAGTHNGMRSVIAELGNLDIPRLRMGIENREEEMIKRMSASDYVLAKFRNDEVEKIPEIFANACEIVDKWLGNELI